MVFPKQEVSLYFVQTSETRLKQIENKNVWFLPVFLIIKFISESRQKFQWQFPATSREQIYNKFPGNIHSDFSDVLWPKAKSCQQALDHT